MGQEFYSLNWIRPKNSEMKSLWALMPILKCKLENRTQPKLLYVYPKVYRDHHYLGILQVPTFHNDPQHCLLMSKHLICRFALSLDNYGWPVAVYLFFTGSIWAELVVPASQWLLSRVWCEKNHMPFLKTIFLDLPITKHNFVLERFEEMYMIFIF